MRSLELDGGSRESTDGPAAPPGPREHELGVLFIHGIGRQRRGETVTEFGDALIKWFDRWHRGASPEQSRPPLRLATGPAAIDGLTEDPLLPANLTVEVLDESAGEPRVVSRWLLAEAWWAEAFTPVSFRELAVWGLQVVPWTILMHFGRLIRRVFPEIDAGTSWLPAPLRSAAQLLLKTFITVLLIGCATLTTLCTLMLVLLLLGLSLIPLPGIGALALRLQALIAAFLGDSYVFLISPVRAAAIVARVRHALTWLAAHCRSVAVVAHSQGGAVAHKALQNHTLATLNLDQVLLVTFGSGLGKLDQLERAVNDIRQRIELRGYWPLAGILGLVLWWNYLASRGELLAAVLMLAGGLVGLSVLIWSVLTGRERLTRAALIGALGATALVFVVAPIALAALNQYDALQERLWALGSYMIAMGVCITPTALAVLECITAEGDPEQLDPARAFGRPVRWVDLYATFDPVSNGSLFETPPSYLSPPLGRSVPLDNHGSFFADHTAYWRNGDGFVGLVARELGDFVALAEGPVVTTLAPQDSARIELGRLRRRWRVRWLRGARWVLLAATAGTLAARTADLARLGEWARGGFASVEPELSALLSLPLGPLIELLGPVVVGVALLCALSLAAALSVELIGWLWESEDTRALFLRESYGITFLRLLILNVAGWLIGAGLVALGWTPLPTASSVSGLLPAAGGLLIGAVVLTFVGMIYWRLARFLIAVFDGLLANVLDLLRSGFARWRPGGAASRIAGEPAAARPDPAAAMAEEIAAGDALLFGAEISLQLSLPLLLIGLLQDRASPGWLGAIFLSFLLVPLLLWPLTLGWLQRAGGGGDPAEALLRLSGPHSLRVSARRDVSPPHGADGAPSAWRVDG